MEQSVWFYQVFIFLVSRHIIFANIYHDGVLSSITKINYSLKVSIIIIIVVKYRIQTKDE